MKVEWSCFSNIEQLICLCNAQNAQLSRYIFKSSFNYQHYSSSVICFTSPFSNTNTYKKAPVIPPTIGPAQNIQWSSQTSAITAAPNDRAGFIPAPDSLMQARCPTAIFIPIENGAIAINSNTRKKLLLHYNNINIVNRCDTMNYLYVHYRLQKKQLNSR